MIGKDTYIDCTFDVILQIRRIIEGERVNYKQLLMINIKETEVGDNGRTYVSCRPIFIAFLLGKCKG